MVGFVYVCMHIKVDNLALLLKKQSGKNLFQTKKLYL